MNQYLQMLCGHEGVGPRALLAAKVLCRHHEVVEGVLAVHEALTHQVGPGGGTGGPGWRLPTSPPAWKGVKQYDSVGGALWP